MRMCENNDGGHRDHLKYIHLSDEGAISRVDKDLEGDCD